MSYMLLVVEEPNEREAAPEPERLRRHESMVAFARDLSDRGLLVSGESLKTGNGGIRLRKRAGKRSMVDGPFAEAKEIVGGYFLLDCSSRQEAIAIADACPAAEWSTIEVREVGPCWDATT